MQMRQQCSIKTSKPRWPDFSGVYNKQEQVYFKAEQEVDEALRDERIRHVFEPVDLPDFDEHVFYVQQHLNDDPAQI